MNDDELQIPLNVPFREPFQRSIELDYFMCSPAQMDPSCRYVYPQLTMDYNSTLASEWKMYLKQQELAALAGQEILLIQEEDSAMVDDVIIEENGDMHVPDVTEREENVFIEDYWTQNRPLFAVDYLPFFSGCAEFDSHIYLYQLLEASWTQIEDFVNYGSCDLVPANETVFISPWAPQNQISIADSCEVEVQCFYEEAFKEAAASTRWYEVEGAALFYITETAESQDALFEASVLANDISVPEVDVSTYDAAVTAQVAIPVIFSPAEGVEVTRGIIPTEIAIDISYCQTSPMDKTMIVAEGTFDEVRQRANTTGRVVDRQHYGARLVRAAQLLRVPRGFLRGAVPRPRDHLRAHRHRVLGGGPPDHHAGIRRAPVQRFSRTCHRRTQPWDHRAGCSCSCSASSPSSGS